MDSMRGGFSLPKTAGDCNVTPGRGGIITTGGGGIISFCGSSVECSKKSACAAHDITADEQDLINRLHKLLGDRWSLIAGRLPWRRVEEIENYCKMRRQEGY